jgi:hypothetical protein
MIKRGFTGTAAVPADQPTVEPASADNGALDTLEKVLDEVEQTPQRPVDQPTDQPTQPVNLPLDLTSQGMLSQVLPTVMKQTADAADPSLRAISTMRKETNQNASLEQFAADAATGVTAAESEPSPEISPEVESYLQKVEQQVDLAPPEVVIADGSQTQPAGYQYPSQPVVVLPITQEEEKLGAKKSPKFSLRWLVEWSRRLMKIFVGKIIYRPVEGTAS